MKKTTLLVVAFVASLMAAKTSFAIVTHVFITKDTYATIDDRIAAPLSKLIDANDTAGIAALCQQGKVVPVKKGWEVDVPDSVGGQLPGAAWVQFIACGPSLTVTSRAFLTSLAVFSPEALTGTMRSLSP